LVIDDEGKKLGEMSTRDAIRLARESGLDLVEVSPSNEPPVCKIMDFGKFKYQQEKKEREARKHQTVVHIKEVKMTLRIGEHDYQVKLKSIKEFLTDGDRVKLGIRYRGRELQRPEMGQGLLGKVLNDISEIGQPDKPAIFEGRSLVVLLIPEKKK